MTEYDLMIVGTGPAGLSAALYAQRLGLHAVVFGDIPGGNLYMIEKISNYPGFPEGMAGTELGIRLFQQAQSEGAHIPMSRLEVLRRAENGFEGKDANGQVFTAPCALAATGRAPVRLPVKHAEMKGVNFCSVCDGPLYRGKEAVLAVVGSDTTAAQHALTLSRIAKKVYLVYRSEKPKMDASHRSLIAHQENIETLSNTEAVGYDGLDIIEALQVKTASGEIDRLPVDGVFLAIGWRPNLGVIDFMVDTDSEGYLKTDHTLMTSVPGFFAAGDIRDTDLNQVLTACADGARAAKHAASFLERQRSVSAQRRNGG